MSCAELEKLFLAGASREDARRHRDSCATCRAAGPDADAVEEIASTLKAPEMPPSLHAALIDVPRRTVSCEGAERLLPLAVENEILPDDERRLSSHLSRCGGCSEAAATLLAARDLAEPIAPPWLAGRLAVARPAKRRRSLGWIFGPKSVIAFAYAAAVVVMLLGFNPADLARKVGVGELGQNTRAAVLVAESSVTDRLGALQERGAGARADTAAPSLPTPSRSSGGTPRNSALSSAHGTATAEVRLRTVKRRQRTGAPEAPRGEEQNGR